VLPDGQVVHTRVAPRRATGPELLHLLVGAEGTLGVITAAHLRLHRLPLHRQFDSFRFDAVAPAAVALRESLAAGVRPLVARIQRDPRLRRKDRPGDAPEPTAAELAQRLLLVAYEGPAELVEVERDIVRDRATAHGGEGLGPAPARRWWGQRFAAGFRLTPLLAEEGIFADYVELGATWRDVAALHDRLTEAFAARGWRTRIALEHPRLEGASLGCAFWGQADSAAAAVAAYDEAWRLAAEVCHAGGGRLGHVYGGGQHRAALLDAGGVQRLALLRAVKRKLDPVGIMNPGVLGTEP
jgi:alkyldihydroxyacetonephosphate synthase